MPLLAGAAEFSSFPYYTAWVQAFINAVNQLPDYPDYQNLESTPSATMDLTPLGFKNWRLYTYPPGGLSLITPSGRMFSIPGMDMTKVNGIPSDNSYVRAKCIVACDKNLDSLLVTFYTNSGVARCSDETVYSSTYNETSVFFLAKDIAGNIFAGSGGPSNTNKVGTITNIIGDNSVQFLTGNTDTDTGEGVFSCQNLFTNENSNKWLVLSKMPNYTREDAPLAKSMMIALTMPTVANDQYKFNIYYRDGKQVYANFSRYSETRRIPFIDPWCPLY